MPKFKLDCYNDSSGVVITFAFDREEDFRRAQDFLGRLTENNFGLSGTQPPSDFYIFENNAQRDAFYDFQNTLTKGRR